MKKNKNKGTPDHEQQLFSQLDLSYARSKEDVWAALESKVSNQGRRGSDSPHRSDKTLQKIVSINRSVFAYAASVALLIGVGLGLFSRFYTTSVKVAPGEFMTHVLPDGSKIHLNAESVISYAPYWWKISRSVQLEGEAFFEVAKGKTFSIYSELGATQVLGTSFNIYTRDYEYQVYCVSGKVQVDNNRSKPVILGPGDFVKLDKEELKKQSQGFMEASVLSWRLNKFIYNTTPLTNVFRDVERHYDVRIQLAADDIKDNLYTGLFERSETAEEALEIICASFDLSVEKNSGRSYIIK